VGNLTLADFDAELIAQGWSRFEIAQRRRYINWGYKDIAGKFEWLWELSTINITMGVGQFSFTLTGTSPDIPGFSSVEWVLCLDDPRRIKLRPMNRDRFVRQWLPLDLTQAQSRGMPDHYILFENRLYVLPPPQTVCALQVHFRRSVGDLANDNDTTAMPADFDEAVVLASLIRCHRRAKEWDAAAEATTALDGMIGDMLTQEQWQDPNQFERVRPDDSWL